MTKTNGKIKDAEFKAKVLTHLDYIKKAQDTHDKKIDDIHTKIDSRVENCHKRFQTIEKDVDTAKGYAKGAGGIGGAGLAMSIINIIKGFIN